MIKKTAIVASILATTIGCASASSAAQRPAAASVKPTHLAIWLVNSDGLSSRAIATGAVGDFGTGKSTPDRSQTLLTLSRGTFKLSTGKIDSDFVHQVTRWPSATQPARFMTHCGTRSRSSPDREPVPTAGSPAPSR